MKVKLINLATGVAIYFALACIVEFAIGWGMQNPWIFITVWSVIMAVADVFVLQPLRKKAKIKKQSPLK